MVLKIKYVFSFSLGGHLFDAIMFDVDNKDSTLGMSCPPAAFVETPILQKVRNLLTPRGTESFKNTLSLMLKSFLLN